MADYECMADTGELKPEVIHLTRPNQRFDAGFNPNLDVPVGSPVWVDYQAGRLKYDDCAVLLGLPKRQSTWLSWLVWRVRVWWWCRRNPEVPDGEA